MAKSMAVGRMKIGGEPLPSAGIAIVKDNRKLIALADIARLHTHLDHPLVRRHAVGGEQSVRSMRQSQRYRRSAVSAAGSKRENVGLNQVMAQIGKQLAQCA